MLPELFQFHLGLNTRTPSDIGMCEAGKGQNPCSKESSKTSKVSEAPSMDLDPCDGDGTQVRPGLAQVARRLLHYPW